MIIFLVLIIFLTSSYYVINLYDSIRSTDSYIQQVYRKTQAYYIFESALPIAIEKLKEDDRSFDSLKDNWAYPLTFKNNIGEITVTIYDEDRFINLNLAGEPLWEKRIERFFKLLNIDIIYLKNLLIWIGKKEGTLDIKFPIKRTPLHSKEELIYIGFKNEDLLGKNMGEEFFPGLLNLSTIYSSGKINVNTAPLHVLMVVDDRIDKNMAMKIIERRNREPFKNINELILVEGMNFDILYSLFKYVDVKSRFFHIITEFRIGETLATFEVIYDRDEGKVVWKKII